MMTMVTTRKKFRRADMVEPVNCNRCAIAITVFSRSRGLGVTRSRGYSVEVAGIGSRVLPCNSETQQPSNPETPQPRDPATPLHHRDQIDLDECAFRQLRHAHGRSGRLGIAEVRGVDLVEGGEIGGGGEIDGSLD